MERHVKETKEVYEMYLQARSRMAYNLYEKKNAETKRKINEADERWGSRIVQNFEVNRKMFREEVNRKTREKGSRWSIGKMDENGDMLVNKDELNKRWAKFSEGLLDVNDSRDPIISVVGNGRGMPVCERCNEEIGYDEISVNVGIVGRG